MITYAGEATSYSDADLLGGVDDLQPWEVLQMQGWAERPDAAGVELLGAAVELLGRKRSAKKLKARIKQRAKAIRKRFKKDKGFRRRVIGGGIASVLLPGIGRRLRRAAMLRAKKLSPSAKRRAIGKAGIFAAVPGAMSTAVLARAFKRLRKRIKARRARKAAGAAAPASVPATIPTAAAPAPAFAPVSMAPGVPTAAAPAFEAEPEEIDAAPTAEEGIAPLATPEEEEALTEPATPEDVQEAEETTTPEAEPEE